MMLRLRLVLGSLVGALLVAMAVCLGAQNLNDRPVLRLGVAQTAPLPSGFLLGLALAAGLFSGGSAVAVAMGRPDSEQSDEGDWE
jgi:hypothetical protein